MHASQNFVRMFDRAKILLGTRGNFKGVGNQSIGIRTVQAMKLIKDIEIGQMSMIKNDIVGPARLGDAVDRERSGLVNRDEKIE